MEIRACNIKKKATDITLWHYTSPAVLWKMLSGEFYATHYRFMNDSAEIIYGIQEFNRFLDQENDVSYLRRVVKYLQEIDFFLLCFSEDPDNLYHWRSYTPGGGFSIGFSYNEMCDVFNNINYGPQDEIRLKYDLPQCRYLSEDDIAKFIRETIGKIQKAIKDLSKEDALPSNQSFAIVNAGIFGELIDAYKKFHDFGVLFNNICHLLSKLPASCPALKKPSFEVEKEHRLVITGENLRAQTEYIGNKPRIKIPLPELAKCIKKVCVSPHGDVEQNYLLAEIAKERFGLDFEIHHSQSTFNGQ